MVNQKALLVVTSLWLSGCPNPNIYGTGRTIPVGRLQHTAAIEGFGIGGSSSAGGGSTGGSFLPSAPTYQLRIGVHDRIDFGIRLSNLTMLGFDTKFNLVRTEPFDLAIQPAIQGTYAAINVNSSSGSNGFGLAYGFLPLIFGFNPSQAFSIILVGGIGFAAATTSSSSGTGASGTGFLVRAGIGFNIRPTATFALHPELTVLVNPSLGVPVFTPGIALQFGRNPDFRPQPVQ